MDLNSSDIAKQLKSLIKTGLYEEIVSLLGPITSHKQIRIIEDKFLCLSEPQVDPVNYAIDCRKERIAIYLVEKAFSLTFTYWEDQAICDDWCYKDHGPDNCPRQYNCSRNAQKHKMDALKLRIDSILQGKGRPGDGLSEPYIDKHMPRTPPPRQTRLRNDQLDGNRQVSDRKESNVSEMAREEVRNHGIRYSTENGGTLLHKHVDKPPVFAYILANHGVPVNVQNNNGDTALHLAVRKGRLDMVQALVQCSADLTVRNKFGRTPVEEAEGSIKSFLQTFEPSVVAAVQHSHYNTMCRLYKRSWCSVHTKVKEGKTLLEWTLERAEGMGPAQMKAGNKTQLKKQADAAKNSFRVLSDYRPTSELIHAVLCEDVKLVRNVLEENPGLSVNVRFRDRLGKTLLSHAIESNNFEIVKLLLENGAHVAQIRVREHEQTDVTVPLYQKALRRDLDPNIVKQLQTILPDSREHEEKDCNGNTPLLRAIEENVDSKMIHWLIKVRGGYSLLDRNCEGFTAREVAHNRGRDSVVKVIDRYIMKELPPIVLRLFPVSFYSGELLNIVDEESEKKEAGDTLEKKLAKTAEEHHMKTWIDVTQTQNQAISLFMAAAHGDVEKIKHLNDANYQDKNGYTALIRAIVFNQLEAAQALCLTRPQYKRIADNCNRYPLHYAYALPKEQGRAFIRLILETDAKEIENRVDKDGRVAAVYGDIRNNTEIRQMLYNARTLDAYGKRGPPLGPWPKDAEKVPAVTEE